MSKFSPSEFISSVKYYNGNSSPVVAEKRDKDYSIGWQHHMGHNKHHWQYWVDFSNNELITIPIPPKYLSEMICDWVGTGKLYNRHWLYSDLDKWYQSAKSRMHMHYSTMYIIERIFMCSSSEADLYFYANPNNIVDLYREWDILYSKSTKDMHCRFYTVSVK
jgi:hypothetical protein